MSAFLDWLDLTKLFIFGVLILSTIVGRIKLSHSKHHFVYERRGLSMSVFEKTKVTVEFTVLKSLAKLVEDGELSIVDLVLLTMGNTQMEVVGRDNEKEEGDNIYE